VGYEKFVGPWNVESLQQAPSVKWGSTIEHPDCTVSQINYSSEPYKGKVAEVFAYYAVPRSVSVPFPAIVLVHGGGGKAFTEWAEQWAKRGYAAIAMDLTGRDSDGSRMEEGGPDMTEENMFRGISEDALTEMWNYHAVAAVIKAVSFLSVQSDIDYKAIGMMGVSWGGYVTEIVAGLDSRLAYAMPVYAAGYYQEGSCWQSILRGMDEEKRQLWTTNFDVKQYIGQSMFPMLLATGTNDTAFYLDSWQKTCRLVKGEQTLRLIANWEHCHETPWATQEFGIYADSIVKNVEPLLRVTSSGRSDAEAWTIYYGSRPVHSVNLHYTSDSGEYTSRSWQSSSAQLDEENKKVSARPPADATAYFFTIEDSSGNVISSDLTIS